MLGRSTRIGRPSMRSMFSNGMWVTCAWCTACSTRTATAASAKRPARSGDGAARLQVQEDDGFSLQLGSAALVGLGVLALSAELLPGMLLGVAAMALPKLVPQVGDVLRPLTASAVSLGSDAARAAQSAVAEAGEQIQDLMAEVEAEKRAAATAAEGKPRARRNG